MIDPEKKLWQRVLLTAVEDAFTPIIHNNKKSPYKTKIIKDARNWLLNNNRQFFVVCSMANIEPLSLRKKVKEILSCEGGEDSIFRRKASKKLRRNIDLSDDIA